MGRASGRKCVIALAVAVFCSLLSAVTPGYAAKPKVVKRASTIQVQPSVKIQNTRAFFSWYHAKGQISKSNFETEEHYRKRLPWFDPNKVVYFRVETTLYGDDAYTFVSPYRKNPFCSWYYKYDADTRWLTVVAGYDISNSWACQKLQLQTPIQIFADADDLGSYVGSNAFGVRARVRENKYNHYVLNIRNIEECPDTVYDPEHKTFCISYNVPPQQARKLCARLQIVVGVRLSGFQRSESRMLYAGTATLANPNESATYHHVIDARLAKVLLMDRVSGKVYTEDDIGNGQ